MDPVDGGCWIATAQRELYEELKIRINTRQFFEYFRGRRGGVNMVKYGRTPVFIGFYPEINVRVTNAQLKLVAEDPKASDCEKEIECVEWFCIATGSTPNNTRHSMSKYAIEVMGLIVDKRN
jgi:8-oxo-dGTP pyrophosphatase MutT (NUDIX family)